MPEQNYLLKVQYHFPKLAIVVAKAPNSATDANFLTSGLQRIVKSNHFLRAKNSDYQR